MAKSSNRYHHGDLRAALLREAIKALDHAPDADITLRGLAKIAGVSPMAPYAHFDDKDALMDAVAIEGFAALGRALDIALATPATADADSPESDLEALARAYVSFGLERQGLYRIMFSRRAKPEGHAVYLAGRQAFAPLEAVAAQLGDDPRRTAEAAWAFVHGLTLLAGEGYLDRDLLFQQHIKLASKAFILAS